MTAQQATMIANARHRAVIDLGYSANDRLVATRTIINLKTSRNASKLKGKWQAVIDMLETQHAA